MDVSVFQYVGGAINEATKVFLAEGLQNFINTLSPFIILCVTVNIMLKGYASIFGKSNDALKDVVIHSIIVVCITGLSLNVSNYTMYIIGAIEGWANGLSAGITSSFHADGGNVEIFKTLDGLLSQGINQARLCFAKMSMWDSESWDWIFSAIAVLITLGSVTLVAGIIIIGTKFLLTLLFLMGPLFLTLACFPVTRKYFDSWFNKLMENCLVQVFGVSVIMLSTLIIEHFLKYNSLGEGDANPLAIAAQIMIIAGIMGFVIRQIPNLAGSLAGGFASGAMTLRDVLSPAQTAAGLAKTGVTAAAGFMAGRAADASGVGQQGNNISRGNGEQHHRSEEAKKQQMVKDMIAERTRQNMEQR